MDPDGRGPAHAAHHGRTNVVQGVVARAAWIARHRLVLEPGVLGNREQSWSTETLEGLIVLVAITSTRPKKPPKKGAATQFQGRHVHAVTIGVTWTP